MRTLTNDQWMIIHNKGLGLRSENNANTITSSASYAMDMDLDWLGNRNVPEAWDNLLMGTLSKIKEFPNSDTRFLMIVNNSRGGSQEYGNCFPKCSARPQLCYVSIALKNNSEETLHDWVIENIK